MILMSLELAVTLVVRLALVLALACSILNSTAYGETPEEWVKLLTRIHGGFGAFLPVGTQIGEDAMSRLDAKPRELSVLFFQGPGTPCPRTADGVMLSVGASPGQGTLQIASEKAPSGAFAVVVIHPRKGGDGLRYMVPMSLMPKLVEINKTIQDPLGRYAAVFGLPDLFSVETVK